MEAKEAKEIMRAGFAWAGWNKEQTEAFKLAYKAIDKAAKYEKALKFYAKKQNYEPFREEDLDRTDAFSLIDLDAGETAKDALEEEAE
ncbi:hypothetical protein KZX50_00665 [Bacillus infantis]|uniref:hypothetical protein n=1 Tax=Bacillus infantis TaxID=324767 RepID=UPI002005582E|nr:hypothetical protein [Bacillus infantis]MCK6203960.1 hypothetical protein [Bacillus infantis]